MRARLGLCDGFAQHVRDVAFRQRRLQLLLARRVDALADEDRVVKRDFDGARAGRDDGAGSEWRVARGTLWAQRGERLVDGGEMRGRRAAAAADDCRAGRDERGDVPREGVGADGEDGAPVHDLRQPRVRLDGNRQRRDGGEALDVGQHLVGPEAAVEPERVDAQAAQERGDAVHVRARQKLAVCAERDGREDRQVAVLLCGEHGGLEFVEVAHRFDDDKIRARARAKADLLGERVVGRVERAVACRFQEAPRRPDVERHEMAVARRAGRIAREADAGGDHVRKRCVAVVLGGICAEGVGVDDVRPGGEIRRVDGADVVRAREVPELRRFAGPEALRLKLGAHAAVEEKEVVRHFHAAQYIKTPPEKEQPGQI